MNGKPAMRTQTDGDQDAWSHATGLACDPEGDKARQEHKNETDINVILGRFGVNVAQRQPTFGEVDYDVDLQTAMAAIGAAQRAHQRLPDSLKERYPDWRSVLNGLHSGQFRIDLDKVAQEARKPKETPPPSGDGVT